MPKAKRKPLKELKSQAQKIWLAGLGAFSEAEKKSDKVFRSLVKRGKKYEAALEQAGETVRGGVSAARNQAGKSFKELESAIDRRVAASMKRLGLASQADVDKLRKEVAKLTQALEKAEKGTSKKKTSKAKVRAKASTKNSAASKPRKKKSKAKSTTKKKAKKAQP